MRSRRRPVLLVVLACVVIAAALAALLARSGGDADSSAAASPPASTDAATAADDDAVVVSGTEAQSSSDSTSPFDEPESFDVFATRDPFEPVIQIPATTPPGQTAPPGQTTPTTTPGSTTPGDTGGGTTAPPSFEPTQREAVALLDVFVDDDGSVKARVQVGSTVFTVGEGQTFATSYQVVSLDVTTGCGQFVFGDTPFQLCEGEQVIK